MQFKSGIIKELNVIGLFTDAIFQKQHDTPLW